MKLIALFFWMLLSQAVLAQSNISATKGLLKWLIKKESVHRLYTKSDISAFYDVNALVKKPLTNNESREIPGKCLQDLMNVNEIKIAKSAPRLLMQTDWRISYSQLKVVFVNNIGLDDTTTVYSFSPPLFLNKRKTRALIGEHFWCGIACGRNDILLCEFKDDRWQLIARAIISNE